MKGDAQVIVATNASAWGSTSLTCALYITTTSPVTRRILSGVGRAGRDGERTEAILFYRDENVGEQKYRTGRGSVPPKQLQLVVETIAGRRRQPVPVEDIAEGPGPSPRKVQVALRQLADTGVIEILPGGSVRLLRKRADPEQAAADAASEQEERRDVRRDMLRHMQEYADTTSCRREFLLRYFGDRFTGPCGNRDNCAGSAAAAGEAGKALAAKLPEASAGHGLIHYARLFDRIHKVSYAPPHSYHWTCDDVHRRGGPACAPLRYWQPEDSYPRRRRSEYRPCCSRQARTSDPRSSSRRDSSERRRRPHKGHPAEPRERLGRPSRRVRIRWT